MAALHGQRLRGPVQARDRVGSTMDEVRHLAAAGADEGIVVVAEEQTGGRGRRGRPWLASPDQSLLFSILLRPALPTTQIPLLASMAGVAVAGTLRASGGVAARTKWPNDVYCRGAKLVGILLEGGLPDFATLGIGVNVRGAREALTAAAGRPATSLEAEGSALLDRERLLALLLDELDRQYRLLLEGHGRELVQAQAAQDLLIGSRVRVRHQEEWLEGLATGLDETGALLVATDRGPRAVCAGEVEQLQFEAGDIRQ